MFTPEEYTAYEESLHSLWDITNAMNDAENKGYGKGKEEGRAEGRAEALLATARFMKADGLPVATIAKYTGLAEAEIVEL